MPVFGAIVRKHFDANGRLRLVNGAVAEELDLDVTPRVRRDGTLVIYDDGLIHGRRGTRYLAWQVEEAHATVLVDARSGRELIRFSRVHTAMARRAFQGLDNFPRTPYWREGEAFPTQSEDANAALAATRDVYDFWFRAFGRDSYDDRGAPMDVVFDYTIIDCPNAFWTGEATAFCNGTVADDNVAHEWMHAVTERTAGLIFAWEPGALSEGISDIFGETIDLVNERGSDAPGALRNASNCSEFTPAPTVLQIHAPVELAGVFPAARSYFGPELTAKGVTADVVVVDDGTAFKADACEAPFVNAAAIVGKIALVERGSCTFLKKVRNAQEAGAVGVIIMNIADDTLVNPVPGPAEDPDDAKVPTLFIGLTRGRALQAATGVRATLRQDGAERDASYRWMVAEDAPAMNNGNGLRDLWSPNCYGHPGKKSDAQYWCSDGDKGGVHVNSGIVSHTYALAADGGTYNGRTLSGIGLTKAAHIYWRAVTTYHTPTTNFSDHADDLERSCADLTGALLRDLRTGQPSGETITANDCAQLALAIAATELRGVSRCGFKPVLAQNAPSLCEGATTAFLESFEQGLGRWSVTGTGASEKWTTSDALPKRRAGVAAFAPNPNVGVCGSVVNEHTGLTQLESPAIVVPDGIASLSFLHSVAVAAQFDGGNVRIRVNDGAWRLIEAGDFLHNPYTATLIGSNANTNPLASQPVFTSADEGAVESAWGTSIIRLGRYAKAGDTIRIRFDFGQNGCGGVQGWFVDDVRVYACPATPRRRAVTR